MHDVLNFRGGDTDPLLGRRGGGWGGVFIKTSPPLPSLKLCVVGPYFIRGNGVMKTCCTWGKVGRPFFKKRFL